MRAAALDRLLADANQAIGKRFAARPSTPGAVPEFIPKQNYALTGNRAPTVGYAARLEIGEYRVFRRRRWPALPSCVCGYSRRQPSVAAFVRKREPSEWFSDMRTLLPSR